VAVAAGLIEPHEREASTVAVGAEYLRKEKELKEMMKLLKASLIVLGSLGLIGWDL